MKKISVFLGVLVVLLAASFFVARSMRPSSGNANPLKDTDPGRVTKISLKSATGSFSLERAADGWMLTEPARDLVDDTTLEPILATLTQGTIGSVISENKDNFEKYGITPSSAAHVRVFVDSAATPSLEGQIGRQGPEFTDSFFRFEGKAQVHLANNMPSFLFHEKAGSYRLKRLFRPRAEEATAFSFQMGKMLVSVEKSSDVWKDSKTGSAVSQQWINELTSRLREVVPAPLDAEMPAADLKFDSSAMTIQLGWGEEKKTAVIGHPTNMPQSDWFARIDGRDPVFTIPPLPFKALLNFLKKPPAKA